MINFVKIDSIVFEISWLQKLITHRQTDATEYMISRRRTAGGWYNDKRSRV